MQHRGRACCPPESTAILDLSGKPSTISSVPFLDIEHAFSLQDFAHSRSSIDREAVDLGSHPSLLRVTLGKVNSEDLSLHLEDRDNNHCLTQWGVHTVIGAGRLLSTFPEPFLLLCSGTSFLYFEVFLLRLPLGHASIGGKLGGETLHTTPFLSPVLSSLLHTPIHQLLKNPLLRLGFSRTYLK